MDYLLHYECPKCEKDVYQRAINLVEEKGLPVFNLDDFSQTMMTCENTDEKGDECGYQFGTGDIEVLGEDEW